MFNLPLQPEQASEFAKPYDELFFATTALTVFFTLVVVAMMVVFCIRYRHGRKADRSNQLTSHMLLEATWTVVPLVLGIIMFFWAAQLFVQQRIPPKDAMEIYVVGKQWMWHIQHPNGVRENNQLHVPIGKPIKLIMISQDVLHSFFVPAFRMKQDVVPGRYSMQWFTATKPGKYALFCAEYCGTQHSEMGGYVYVMSQSEYSAWLASGGQQVIASKLTAPERGKLTYEQLACGNCHGAEDNERGTSLYGLIGRLRRFTDGSTAVADRDYFRESLLDPYKRINEGYDKTMPDYTDQLDEQKVLDIFEYVKTLGSVPEGARAQATGAGGAG
jgi:cytochrome c oxidase subunit 2